MGDVAVNLQTPIMRSTLDKINALKERHGHANAGETIGWVVEENEKLMNWMMEEQ